MLSPYSPSQPYLSESSPGLGDRELVPPLPVVNPGGGSHGLVLLTNQPAPERGVSYVMCSLRHDFWWFLGTNDELEEEPHE